MSQLIVMLSSLFGNLKPGEFNTFFLVTNYSRSSAPISSYYCLKLYPRYIELLHEKNGSESNHKFINGSWQKNGAQVSKDVSQMLTQQILEIAQDLKNGKASIFQKQKETLGSINIQNRDITSDPFETLDYNDTNEYESSSMDDYEELGIETLESVTGGLSEPLGTFSDFGINADSTNPILVDLSSKKIIQSNETFKQASDSHQKLISGCLENASSFSS